MYVNECFKAFSDSIRREILFLLKKNVRMSAGDICNCFDLTNATVSYHISILQKAELIYEEREGKYIYYTLNISIFEELILWFEHLVGDKQQMNN